jgi:CheY-like chemotaxis protein
MGHRLRILIVDDVPEIRESLAEILELEGFAATTARGGAEALAWLREFPGPVAAIIVDIHMPGMTGPEFIAEARRSGVLNGTPVITMTASDIRIEGAAAHVRKPCNPARLIRTLRDVCRRTDES